ncbi:MAG TPA: hypothetical protein VF045_02380, partial [Acidimicrobiales bacterium]
IAHLAAMFGFVYVLLSPATERVDAAQPAPLLAMLALFVTFGTLSVLFWGYFRFRRHRPVGAPAWSAPSVDSELARSWRAMAP